MYGLPIIAAGIVSLLIGFASGWQIQDWRFTSKIATIQAEHSKVMAEMAESARAAEATYRQIEANTRAIADEEREKNREKVAAINRDLANAIEQLRKRPESSSSANNRGVSKNAKTGPDSYWCTGAQLYGDHATAFAREAARAAEIQALLSQCSRQYNAVEKTLNQSSE